MPEERPPLEHHGYIRSPTWKKVVQTALPIPILLFPLLGVMAAVGGRSIAPAVVTGVAATFIGFAIGWWDGLITDEYFCKLDDARIWWEFFGTPAVAEMVRLANIARLEYTKAASAGPATTYWIVERSGRRVEIPGRFGNPAEQFFGELLIRCTKAELVERR